MTPARTQRRLYSSPNRLSEEARTSLVEALEARLIDGLDLHSQIKVAHWNVKGPHFAALHPLFETFAVALAGFNDDIAERAVTLGGTIDASSRSVAARTSLPNLTDDVTRDLELVKALSERFEVYLDRMRESRDLAEEVDDADTVDLMTTVIETFEKHAWFLRATLER
jgi:starvation-inducible DNA-binding protein